MGIVEEGRAAIKAGDDAAEAKWFKIDQLPKEMAFDHDEISCFAIGRLKRKKAYRQVLQ
jgi:8-oxo-dGTP diphosphatase